MSGVNETGGHKIRILQFYLCTWLIEGCPMVFLLEVVSSPQREEKRLRRLLKVRGMAWFRFLMLLSVRADTCDGKKIQEAWHE